MSRILNTAAAAALLGTAALALTAGGASAYVACNEHGDCWHSDHRANYPGIRVQWHNDNWGWHHDWDNDRNHHWHHYHQGRGYWRDGQWVPQ